ncbi:hypothetical protein NEPTK9_000565 [Candidatus Neptunochlamydia vexilliferae]|uniref:Uncharacterized protein n=2 Tax=Candidatus Neptunichlamydia vexilliferae TaxID=1651774 RepID=A0ABS0AY51_9BACT|nr:hypothetical protein [Candidatus Neptunochlamydia vexilliferae]
MPGEELEFYVEAKKMKSPPIKIIPHPIEASFGEAKIQGKLKATGVELYSFDFEGFEKGEKLQTYSQSSG